ncbi:MAG: histidine phosphatase family protein [Chloroflexota bacterium]
MKRILLIRHGQTDWNTEGRWQGQLQVPLNHAGQEQAQALADYLRGQPITAVYSSDLSRAHVTATYVADALQLLVKPDPRWRELHLGVLQGLTINEVNSLHPNVALGMREDYLGYEIPEGESRRVMQARAYEAYQDIIANEPGGAIAVVSHGGTIRVLLLKLFGDSILQKSVHNTSISVIETDGMAHHLLETAITPHLMSESQGIASRSDSNLKQEVL